ncbi:SET domain-containing protein [Xylariaceae sp. FL0662B]|nr:SET domain-containing protein [Xylariaceae sp. FL0662B]
MRLPALAISLALLGETVAETVNGLPGVCPWNPFRLAANRRPATAGKVDSNPVGWDGFGNCTKGPCIFSNPHIGGGITLVTSERNARIVAGFPALQTDPNATTTASSEPFHEAEVAGKGVGLVADRLIRRGEVITVRTPTMMVQTAAHVGLRADDRAELYDGAVDRLPVPRRDAFMRQMGRDVYDKIETNCFQVHIDGANKLGSHLGCYPEISRFNHDCRPNLNYRITNTTHTTVAVRDIAVGEELSISYIGMLYPRSERQKLLRHWGFNCTCAQCSGSAAAIAASDARITEIGVLERALESTNETTDAVAVTPDTGARLVELYEAERLDVYVGEAYTRAALNYALFGDEVKAQQYARVAAEAMEREFGPGSGDARAMRVLAENPRAHWTWGKRRRSSRRGKR